MSIIEWIKNSYNTVAVWFKTKGLRNAGWLVAFVALYLYTGIPAIPVLAAAGLVFLGIFIEKNRKSLSDIYKEVKAKAEEKIKNNN